MATTKLSRREIAQGRHEHEQLLAKIERNQFLQEWLEESQADQADLQAIAQKEAVERTRAAVASGYRSWRNFEEAANHIHDTLHHYVHHRAFHELWNHVREWDKSDILGPNYGPHNGGVPARLLDRIRFWYLAPKFTGAELAKHKRKIFKACNELVYLLEQLTPGGIGDPFRTLRMTAEEADRLFALFDTPKRRRARWGVNEWTGGYIASQLLERAGITPVSAISRIAEATRHGGDDGLPTKVRAASAFRTYMIRAFFDVVVSKTPYNSTLQIPDHLIAELASVIVRTECDPEDVRKALAPLRAAKDERNTRELAEMTELRANGAEDSA